MSGRVVSVGKKESSVQGDAGGIKRHQCLSGKRIFPLLALCLTLAVMMVSATGCTGGESSISLPNVNIDFGTETETGTDVTGFHLLLLLTVLATAPALLIMVTSFTRIVIVLALVRSAMGIPQVPPTQLLLGLALFLTFFVMSPTWNKVNQNALQPYIRGEMTQDSAFKIGEEAVREFLFKQTRQKDLALFVSMAQIENPRNPSDVPTYCLIPAFVISELKTAFQMGFYIFVPFLIIDMVVASTLLSMGMMMLPPAIISLPFKVLLFTLVDGWHLVVKSVLLSFN